MNTEEWDRLKQDEIDNNVSACGALLHIVHTLADCRAWIAGDGRDALVHARFTKR